jgi:hypothetical protein
MPDTVNLGFLFKALSKNKKPGSVSFPGLVCTLPFQEILYPHRTRTGGKPDPGHHHASYPCMKTGLPCKVRHRISPLRNILR